LSLLTGERVERVRAHAGAADVAGAGGLPRAGRAREAALGAANGTALGAASEASLEAAGGRRRETARRQAAFLGLLGAAALLLALAALRRGALECSLGDLFEALLTVEGDETLRFFVRHLRLPRVLAALAAGAVLAVNGAVLQNVLNNPLASSFTLGLSQGAAFGASVAIIGLGGASLAPALSLGTVAACAFAGSMATSILVMSFTMIRGMSPQGLILAGVAISTLLGAITMALQYFATDAQVVSTIFWTFGDLGKGGWPEAAGALAAAALGLAMSFRLGLDFDALKWGDAQAAGLGVDVRRVRLASLMLTALTTAVVTAFFGVIGFVGLIGPHMIRLFFPHAGHGFLLPASALFGGVFILGSDILAQWLIYPLVLPIGILCSFAGAPMFLFLLLRRSLSRA
jgi:iron complex transport system permease protein